MDLQKKLDNLFMEFRLAKSGLITRIELPAIITKTGITVNQSTVDYSGHYKGYPVAFDAKECKDRLNVKTNFKTHQVTFLRYFKDSCLVQKKVISGFMINYYELDPDNLYFLDIDYLSQNDRKSIGIESEFLKKLSFDKTFMDKLLID